MPVSDTQLFYENARKLKHNFPEQQELHINREEQWILHDENKFMSVLEPTEVEGMKVIIHEGN